MYRPRRFLMISIRQGEAALGPLLQEDTMGRPSATSVSELLESIYSVTEINAQMSAPTTLVLTIAATRATPTVVVADATMTIAAVDAMMTETAVIATGITTGDTMTGAMMTGGRRDRVSFL